MAYKNASSTYKETKVTTASPGQLILLLYDEAIRQLTMAIEMLVETKKENKVHDKIEYISKAIMKAEEIITELMASLDFEQGGEISNNLFSLYSWFNRELMEANIAQDENRIKGVCNMLTELRNSWNEAVKNYSEKPAPREAIGLNIAG